MSQPSKVEWEFRKIKLGQMVPWDKNPREIYEDEARRLVEGEKEFGQVETFAVGPPNKKGKYPLYNGHQRRNTWLEEYGPDHEVGVMVASRKLTEQELKKLVALLHHGATGRWNTDIVSALYTDDELIDWGMPQWMQTGGYEDLEKLFEERLEDLDEPSKNSIILRYTDEEYKQVIDAFGELDGTKEDILFDLLGLK